jgi:hypothetical protein
VHVKDGAGMPALTEAEFEGLRADPPVVVLLATSPEGIVAGDVALQLAGFRPVLRATTTLDGAVVDVEVRIVALG